MPGGFPRASLYLLLVYGVTLPSALIADAVVPSADLVACLKLGCVAAFAWHAAAVVAKPRHEFASLLALAAATGLTWTAVGVIYLYKVVTLVPLNVSEVIWSLGDARATLVHTLGEYGVAIAIGALVVVALAATGAAWLLFRALRPLGARFATGPRSAAVCLLLVAYFAAADLWFAAGELVLYGRPFAGRAFSMPRPSVPDYSAVAVRSGESVLIVQLESVNAFAVFEPVADGAGFRPRIAQPGLETILKEGGGVLFPLFWANSTQTNRAWESILCGVSGNVGPAFSIDPARLLRRTCLPAHLAGAGYATVFLYAYFDLEFFNLRGFATRAGFQDVAYGPKLMKEGDRRHQWAYDDCVFYERAFDYLARQGLERRERVFAYLEVGMNHFPFFDSMKHPQAHPYPAPATPLEHYLNAVAEQDHCLLTFWKRFRALARDDVHIFILPDHSLWLRSLPLQPDSGFATWLAYVPPARRAAEFKPRAVLAPTPSQAQIYPTVLELLGGEALPQSFAFSLRGENAGPHYDDCHVLGEPFQRLIVRKGGERAEFRLHTSQIVPPQGGAEASDLPTFQQRYGCK